MFAAGAASTRRILTLLTAAHGPRTWAPRRDAVEVLVGTILSQNTSNANSSAGLRALRRRLPSWNAVADARVSTIETSIRVSGLSRVKAPRIGAILRRIRADRGRISLAFLSRWGDRKAYDYLVDFDGVGPKTALCVLMFAFGKPVFPVDTHVHRIARRLGLLGNGVSADRAHEALTPLIAPGDRYAMHVLLIAHGQATCRAQNPRCEACCLLKLCPYGRTRKESTDERR